MSHNYYIKIMDKNKNQIMKIMKKWNGNNNKNNIAK